MSYNVSDASWYRYPRNDRRMLVYNSCCQRLQWSHVWDIKANRILDSQEVLRLRCLLCVSRFLFCFLLPFSSSEVVNFGTKYIFGLLSKLQPEHSSVSPLKVKKWFVLKNVLRFFAMFTGTQKILRRLFATLPFVIIRPLRFNKDFGSPPRTQRCRISVLICALTAPKPSVFSKLNPSGIKLLTIASLCLTILHFHGASTARHHRPRNCWGITAQLKNKYIVKTFCYVHAFLPIHYLCYVINDTLHY